jgi:hypothetical protein
MRGDMPRSPWHRQPPSSTPKSRRDSIHLRLARGVSSEIGEGVVEPCSGFS